MTGFYSVHRSNEHRILYPKIQIRTAEWVRTSRGDIPPNTPLTKEDDFMKDKEKFYEVKVRLNDEEHTLVKKCAELCGLTQKEFLRQLIMEKNPKPIPPMEFWDMMSELYRIHESFAVISKYEPSAKEECRKIEELVLRLQEAV